MVEVREIFRRVKARQSLREIARETGLNRKTVRRYVEAGESIGVDRDGELSDDFIGRVIDQVQSRPEITLSDERQKLVKVQDAIKQWLENDPPLKLSKIQTLLLRQGIDVGYSTLRRFAIAEFGFGQRKPTVRIEDPPPGQEVQADFGLMGVMIDPVTQKRRRLWALIVTLSHSRYMFVWPTFDQTMEAVCDGLDAAWTFFGGICSRLVIDNLKPVIDKADALSPKLNPSFQEYAEARGLFVDAARVRHPKDKPRVENQVAYVRESWFAGEKFCDLEEAQRSAEVWCRDIAGDRLHGTTRKRPREVFENIEKSALMPPPKERFDVPVWTEAKVHPDHHLQVARSLYSVPTRFIGRKVRVRIDQKIVRIYAGSELIKIHARVGPGERSTDADDYPKYQAAYAFRSIDRLIEEAKKRGVAIGELASRLLTDCMPWRNMRQVYKLIHLADRFGKDRVNEACSRAIAFEVYDVRRIERLLKLARKVEDEAQVEGRLIPLPARFARSLDNFRTQKSEEEKR